MTSHKISLASGVVPEFGPVETVDAAAGGGWDAAGLWVEPAHWTVETTRGVRQRLATPACPSSMSRSYGSSRARPIRRTCASSISARRWARRMCWRSPPILLVRDRYPDPAERSRVTAQTTHAFLARAGRAIEAR